MPPLFGIMFFLIFGASFSLIIYGIVTSVKQWHKNNNSPRLTVPAKIVAKRTNVSHSHHHHGNGHVHTSSSTSYYITFEFESGDRMEFHVYYDEYGLLVEGDYGNLTFQGTRYLGFERIR